MPTAPIQESSSAQQIEDGPAAAASGPGDGESLAHTTGASATTTEAVTENVNTLEAEAATIVDAPEAKEATPSMAEEQLTSPAATSGVVGAAVQPRSPPVVPQSTAEEDEVVEIERCRGRRHHQGDKEVKIRRCWCYDSNRGEYLSMRDPQDTPQGREKI